MVTLLQEAGVYPTHLPPSVSDRSVCPSLTPQREPLFWSTSFWTSNIQETWTANEPLPFPADPQRRSTRCHGSSTRLNSRLFAGWFEKYAGVHVRSSISQPHCGSFLAPDLQKLEVFEQRNQSEGCREEQGGGVGAGELRCWTSGDGVGDAGLIQLMVLRERDH